MPVTTTPDIARLSRIARWAQEFAAGGPAALQVSKAVAVGPRQRQRQWVAAVAQAGHHSWAPVLVGSGYPVNTRDWKSLCRASLEAFPAWRRRVRLVSSDSPPFKGTSSSSKFGNFVVN